MNYNDSTDGQTLRWNTLKFKENSGRVPSDFTYPSFYYVLTSFFPRENLIKNLWKFGIVCLIALVTIVSLFLYQVFPENALTLNLLIVCLGVVPALLMEVRTVSIRPLSFLVFNATMLAMVFAFSMHDAYLFFASLSGVAVLMFTHKFAFQTLAFVCLCLSIAFNNLSFIWGVVAVFALLAWNNKGYYRQVFEGHVAICRFWKQHANRQKGSLVERLSKGVINPFILTAFAAILFTNETSALFVLFMVWFLATFFLFVVIAFKPLAFLGENHRYLEYGVVPSIFLTGYLLQSDGSWLTIVLLLALFSALASWQIMKRVEKAQTHFNEPKFAELVGWLNTQPKGKLFAFGKPRARLACETKHNVFFDDNPTHWIEKPFIVFDDLIPISFLREFDFIVSEETVNGFSKAFDNGVYKVFVDVQSCVMGDA